MGHGGRTQLEFSHGMGRSTVCVWLCASVRACPCCGAAVHARVWPELMGSMGHHHAWPAALVSPSAEACLCSGLNHTAPRRPCLTPARIKVTPRITAPHSPPTSPNKKGEEVASTGCGRVPRSRP
jgi:hypothetical protein